MKNTRVLKYINMNRQLNVSLIILSLVLVQKMRFHDLLLIPNGIILVSFDFKDLAETPQYIITT